MSAPIILLGIGGTPSRIRLRENLMLMLHKCRSIELTQVNRIFCATVVIFNTDLFLILITTRNCKFASYMDKASQSQPIVLITFQQTPWSVPSAPIMRRFILMVLMLHSIYEISVYGDESKTSDDEKHVMTEKVCKYEPGTFAMIC